MRQWTPAATTAGAGNDMVNALGAMVRCLSERGFETTVLQALQPLVPAASWSVYRIGPHCQPMLFMSASHDIADTTRDCWWAYLSGPHLRDRSWSRAEAAAQQESSGTRLCHITAGEIGGEHKARVYDAHGMSERLSIVQRESDGSLFAVNLYRHQHQRSFRDAQIVAFGAIAPALLELSHKQIALTRAAASPQPSPPPPNPRPYPAAALRERLLRVHARLTPRELEVCVRLLQGMTQEGVACDLGLSVATVKTYRNRAFARLGIHFRNELFALVLGARAPD